MAHFFPKATPEALLSRNDSKNPSTTCQGITNSGRPCRRTVAPPKSSSSLLARRKPRTSEVSGVVTLLQADGEVLDADYYCWQHKHQAEQRVADDVGRSVKRRSTELIPLQEKTSIDTLVQRLGITAASENESPERRRKTERKARPPVKTEIHDFASQADPPNAEKRDVGRSTRRKSKTRKPGFWESLCCMAGAGGDDDYIEIVRHRKKRVEQSRPRPRNMVAAPSPSNAPVPTSKAQDKPIRPTPPHWSSSHSQTSQLLSLIPPHLAPQATSALLAELIKPISGADEEGYIYIFWLTPQSNAAPTEEIARSLLASDRPPNERRISDVMTEFSFDSSEPEMRGRRTIKLKIGRASNVTRRMNEWQRQCGYALNLVRWYPYLPSSATPPRLPADSRSPRSPYPDLSRPPMRVRESEGALVRKVPCVKRVERLIHLELHEKQVKRQCAACGKEHREWFEVEASRGGIRAVDESVRRWVGWAETQSN